MSDLTTPEGVVSYLATTPFAASSVVPISGGFSNFTYRVTLREPYSAGLEAPVKTLVLKHAEPYVAAWKETPFDIERQVFECLAFKSIPELVAPSSLVRLPALYYEDRENSVVLMTDSGPDSHNLKVVLQSGPLPDDLAHNIGTELGTFLARLHTSTRDPLSGTHAHMIKTRFAKNRQARGVMSKFFYGPILDIFASEPSLLTPPLVLPPETIAKLDEFVQETRGRVESSDEVLLMGDFWTGNLLLAFKPTTHVMVVDWEGARPGFPGLDIGQFLAELHCLRVFHPDSRSCVDIIVDAFISTYRTIVLQDGNHVDAEQRLAQTARDAAGRMGAHLIVLTPRKPWGGPELTREVVLEGVGYIMHSMDGDFPWLRSSIVGGLLGQTPTYKKRSVYLTD